MAPPDAMDIDGGGTAQAGGQETAEAPSASVPPSTSSSIQQPPTPAAAPRYKYKYPEAYPTPAGEDDEIWNKLYTAADSRMYNKHGKTAIESKKRRTSGETYQLALRMLQERKDKAALVGSGSAASTKAATPKPTAKKPSSTTSIKKAPSSSSGNATPSTDRMSTMMSISEMIKSEGRARKSSSAALSDHGTPAPSIVPTIMGNPALLPPPAPKMEKPKKKGTAAPVKKRSTKRKHDDNADTPSSSRRASLTPVVRNSLSSEEDSNDGGEYCICRGPDDHRMMVYCEGGCKEWYHCSCLDIDVDDAKELLDRFICKNCETEEKFTTWKRLCRYFNVGKVIGDPNACRKPARVSDKYPSKYCSDEHRDAFWKWTEKYLARQDEEPSRGGRLSAGEVGWLLSQGLTAAQLHALGGKPKLPVEEGADPNRPPGLNFLTEEAQQEIQEITERQGLIDAELQHFKDKEKLRALVCARAEIAVAHQGLKSAKDLCGFDSRLALNPLEFAMWARSEEGIRAFETGVLGPQTAEMESIGTYIPMPGQTAAEPEVADVLKSICLKKRCGKHLGWVAGYKDRFSYNYNLLAQEKKRLSERKEEIISNAETTEAMRPEYSDNVTMQLC